MALAHSDTVRRAALPELMLVEDVALALRVTPATARRLLLRGDCGPFLRIGRRLAVLRESFLAHLRDHAACEAVVAELEPVVAERQAHMDLRRQGGHP